MRLRRIEPHLRRALAGPCRMPPGARLLVAVSGGADSTALLVGLARIGPEFGIALHAAHLHHGLRGVDADLDLRFVRRLCARLGVPLITAHRDGRALMAQRGRAGENGLRMMRRRFLRAAMLRARATAIATAHTADDQLETVLMRLLRGAGLRGLGGMRERHGPWLKPLLDATRIEVVTDLRAARMKWREDRSNRDRAWTRNRIRHDAIPALLSALEPARARAGAAARARRTTARTAAPDASSEDRAAFARRVAAVAREARDAERALGIWLDRTRPPFLSIQDGAATLDRERLAAFPIAARRMALRRAWRRVAPAGVGLTRRHMAALCNLVAGSHLRRRLDLPAGVRAERGRDTIRLIPEPAGRSPRKPIIIPRPRSVGGRHPAGPSAWGEP
jgi:tRNA(Ile)-lysidine synthase